MTWVRYEERIDNSAIIPVGTRVRVVGRPGKPSQGKVGTVVESFRQQPSRIGSAKVRFEGEAMDLWFETKELRPA